MEALSKTDPAELERIEDSRLNHEAYLRIINDQSYHPMSSIIPELIAAQLEPWLETYKHFHPRTRVAIFSFVRWNTLEGNWAKSRQTARVELSLQARDIEYWKAKWPQMWLVINALMRQEQEDKLGRVIGAMADAAISGDNRDRRLYLEFFGHIRRELPEASGGKTIIFVNDTINRPQPLPLAQEAEVVDEGSEGEDQ